MWRSETPKISLIDFIPELVEKTVITSGYVAQVVKAAIRDIVQARSILAIWTNTNKTGSIAIEMFITRFRVACHISPLNLVRTKGKAAISQITNFPDAKNIVEG